MSMMMSGLLGIASQERLGLLLHMTTTAEESPEAARMAGIAHVVGLLREQSKGRKGHIDLMALSSRGEGLGWFVIAKETAGEEVTMVVRTMTEKNAGEEDESEKRETSKASTKERRFFGFGQRWRL
ncbi:unnamed protein product [Arabis nemorensis]|uniref:Uncharacterized protein n=1 Tax=Arabis nemorensis TaxID=586526 RepID=A0A565AQJ6_9BRAS|nr:unnamed protein product [Arabis nemorensis]